MEVDEPLLVAGGRPGVGWCEQRFPEGGHAVHRAEPVRGDQIMREDLFIFYNSH